MEKEIKYSPIEYTAHIEVRYAETDAMAIVHHSVYAIWFEQARTEIFRENGVPFSAFEAEGYHSPLLSIETQFMKPCRYGEIVDVHLQLAQIDRLRFAFFYEVTVNGELRTTGKTTHIFTMHDKPYRHAPEPFLKAFFNEAV
jgi:acyl-CoA thioester hydrolase